MIQEIGDKKFDNQYIENITPEDGDRVFIFQKAERGPDLICLTEGAGGEGHTEELDVPTFGQLKAAESDEKEAISAEDLIYAFAIDDERFFLAKPGISVSCPDGFAFQTNRMLRKAEPKHLAFAAMTACHLNIWYKNNQFCGRCGAELQHDSRERMMRCPECGNMIFPKIMPAVTVALLHEDKLLVTKYAGREQTSFYALIAGFVEIGESMEECVKREVMEEVGLKAKNVRYWGDQPWGFVGNLQVGFVAEVDGDPTITMDEDELAVAFFISREELEPNTVRPALTQEMIEAFREGRL